MPSSTRSWRAWDDGVTRMMAVAFTRNGRLYYLDAGAHDPRVGDKVLFPTSTSPEVVEVVWGPEEVEGAVGGLPVCVGPASAADIARDEDNRAQRARIQVTAQRLIREHKLPMKVSAVDWTDIGHESGRPTATIYFTAGGRVDFRELVRSIAQTLDCKVVLTQLTPRDDARVKGGIGSCGRDTCCSTFLVDFDPVTVRMARDQDLPANPMGMGKIRLNHDILIKPVHGCPAFEEGIPPAPTETHQHRPSHGFLLAGPRRHRLDQVVVEPTAQTAVRGNHHQQHCLDGFPGRHQGMFTRDHRGSHAAQYPGKPVGNQPDALFGILGAAELVDRDQFHGLGQLPRTPEPGQFNVKFFERRHAIEFPVRRPSPTDVSGWHPAPP